MKEQDKAAYRKAKKIVMANQELCGICGFPVDKSEKYRMEVNGISTLNPLAPTIDHIIPLEKGGSPTDLGNLQLAHWKCNNAKRTKLIIQPKPIENDAPMDWEAILLSP